MEPLHSLGSFLSLLDVKTIIQVMAVQSQLCYAYKHAPLYAGI